MTHMKVRPEGIKKANTCKNNISWTISTCLSVFLDIALTVTQFSL